MKSFLKLTGFGFCETGFFTVNLIAVKPLIQPGFCLTKVIPCDIAHGDSFGHITKFFPDSVGIQFLVVGFDAFEYGSNALQLAGGLCFLLFFRKAIEPTFMLFSDSLAFLSRFRFVVSLELIFNPRILN